MMPKIIKYSLIYKWLCLVIAFILVGRCAIAEEKFEPKKGCYIGIALDWADIATEKNDKSITQKFSDAIATFNKETGKSHALIKQFIYFPHGAQWENKAVYGKFPTWNSDPAGWASCEEFCKAVDANGGTPAIVLEPQANFEYFYNEWQKGNPAYEATVSFAEACAKFTKPIFIIFAHEMNGSWYPWSVWIDKNNNLTKDKGEETGHTPEKYQEAFRNVSAIFHKKAPNVAMVWCPNQGWLGKERIDPYTPFYPGDEYVDWVGLDFYERGWNLPPLEAKLWGGLFIHGLTHDCMDNPETEDNESVNFYKTFCEGKDKPLMISETGATCTHRIDFSEEDRKGMSHNWKAHWWNSKEYSWLISLYGTSCFQKFQIDYPIDKMLPKLKGIIWFNQAKSEDIPSERRLGDKNKSEIVWFKKGWFDYRIGWNSVSGINKYSPDSKYPDEVSLYNSLVENSYFISKVSP